MHATTLANLTTVAKTHEHVADTLATVARQLGAEPSISADSEGVTVHWSMEKAGAITVAVETTYSYQANSVPENGITVDGHINGLVIDAEDAGRYAAVFTNAQNLLNRVTEATTPMSAVDADSFAITASTGVNLSA